MHDFQRHLFPAAHYRLLGMFCGFNFKLHENLQAATRRTIPGDQKYMWDSDHGPDSDGKRRARLGADARSR